MIHKLMQKTNLHAQVEELEADGLRADRYISVFLKLFPRSQIKQREVEIEINGQQAKLSRALHVGDELDVYYMPEQPLQIVPENIPLDIIYENEHCLVINKPQGMVVHPAAGNYTGTLVQALLWYVPQLKTNFADDLLRPGIVHRLDKDTSGIIIAAKTPQALEFLSKQFVNKTLSKHYLAIVKGVIQKPQGNIDYPIARDPHHRKRFTWKRIDGKEAHTKYRVMRNFSKTSFVALTPSTGRTHQLRVHMSSLGHPIVGDSLYSRSGGSGKSYSLMLHAYKLKIQLPGEKAARVFRAHLPSHFRKALIELRFGKSNP